MLKWYIYDVNYISIRLPFPKTIYLHYISSLPALSAIHSSFTVANAFTLYHHHLQFAIPWPQVGSLHRRAVTSESTGLGSRLKPNVPRFFIPRYRWYSGGNITKKVHNTFPLHILTEIIYLASFLNFKHYNSR